MLSPSTCLKELNNLGVKFFTGVPDSLLRDFCECITDSVAKCDHVIAVNEGGAVGIAIGKYIATEAIPLVYMQNSGLGNAVNPLMSLASKEIYSIPMLLMIGWRGEPRTKDEPQHIHQGRSTIPMLKAMDIPYIILSQEQAEATRQLQVSLKKARELSSPVALLVKKGSFYPYIKKKLKSKSKKFLREEAIKIAVERLGNEIITVCTTGMASRELFEYRSKKKLSLKRDFLTVGGMGHASQIALGIAMARQNERVACYDGDGAVLMHMGSLPLIGRSRCKNFIHIVFNNGVHDSVGGQPTIGRDIDLTQVAAACGYSLSLRAISPRTFNSALDEALTTPGPNFIEVVIDPGNRPDIGRPTSKPEDNKFLLMDVLS